jgi:tRNA 2-thiouridine synthesizing protein A
LADVLLDLRGMRCPWPALRVARAIREAGPNADIILAVADDPIAPGEITAVAVERGWSAAPQITEIGPALRLSATPR